jgi:DNA-directed RNA polymerase specialized sigma24 family protein
MSESINLMILDRFRHVERMMRVAAPPCEDRSDSPRSADTEKNSRQSSQNDKISTAQGVLKRDAVLPFLLCNKRGMKQKEIADEIRVSPSTLSEMINRLVEDGYVERKADEDDRRAKTLFPAVKIPPGVPAAGARPAAAGHWARRRLPANS